MHISESEARGGGEESGAAFAACAAYTSHKVTLKCDKFGKIVRVSICDPMTVFFVSGEWCLIIKLPL